MPIELCPIRKSDAPVLTEMIFEAYKDDILSHLMFNNNVTPSMKAWTLQEYEKSWGQNPEERHIGVRDTETGELIASSHWYIYPQREGDDWKKIPVTEWPDGYNKEGANHIQAIHITKRNEIMGAKPYICKASNPLHTIERTDNVSSSTITDLATQSSQPASPSHPISAAVPAPS